MGAIPWNRRLAAVGESAIDHRLKYFSNPMKPDRNLEVEIDFYCELKADGIFPSKLFLVQAKGTEHFDDKWGRSFGKETIAFWLNQFSPVYIIVFDDVSKNCYWMSIEEKRDILMEKLKSKTETIYLTVDKTKILGEDQNHEFVRQIKQDLESLEFRLNLMRGTPIFIGEGYVKKIPVVLLPDNFAMAIRDRIRQSMVYLINNYRIRGDFQNAYILCEFLLRFDQGHYDHFVLFGQICKILNKKEAACLSYKKAIEICRGNKNWDLRKKPTDPSINDLIASIEREMRDLGCASKGETRTG